MIKNLKVSDTVEICVIDRNYEKQYYKTKIEDIALDNIFYTMVPTSADGRNVIFNTGQIYEMYVHRNDGIAMWRIKYISSVREGNLVSCQFRAISQPTVTQRREFYRQNVSINFHFILLEEHEEKDIEPKLLPGHSLEDLFFKGKTIKEIHTVALAQGLPYEIYDGRMLDISGGGCAFASNTLLALQSKILIEFSFRGTRFEFEGLVLDRMKFTTNRTNWDYRYRLQWINTRGKVIDDLVKLIFAEQREMLMGNNK